MRFPGSSCPDWPYLWLRWLHLAEWPAAVSTAGAGRHFVTVGRLGHRRDLSRDASVSAGSLLDTSGTDRHQPSCLNSCARSASDTGAGAPLPTVDIVHC